MGSDPGLRAEERFGRCTYLPVQVVDVEQQKGHGVLVPKLVEDTLPPPGLELLFRSSILVEKAVTIVGDLKEIKDFDDHRQMADEDRMGQLARQNLVAMLKPLPQFRSSLAQAFPIDFREAGMDLEGLVDLIRSQTADRDTSQQFVEAGPAEAPKNVRKLHFFRE